MSEREGSRFGYAGEFFPIFGCAEEFLHGRVALFSDARRSDHFPEREDQDLEIEHHAAVIHIPNIQR